MVNLVSNLLLALCSFAAFIESVNVGDRIGIMVDASGQLSFYLNGTSLGAASPGLPTGAPLHLVVDYQGSLKTVRVLPEITKPMTQQELEKDLLIGLVKSDAVSAKVLEAKISEPDGESEVLKADKRSKRLPLHYLCQNGNVTAGMIKLLTDVDGETVAAKDNEGNTSLLCLLKMASTANLDGAVTCDKGHSLAQDPRRFNYCDVCRATGTKYRCSTSCDYDMCDNCFQKKASKVKKPKGGADVSMVRHLVETHCEVVGIADANGKLPVQVASELGLTRNIIAFLLEATQDLGVVWLGAPAVSTGVGVHLLLHVMGDDGADPATKQLRFDASFQGLDGKGKDSAGDATSLNNLPFSSSDVAQSVCGPGHTVFALHDGRIFRLEVSTVDQQASARVSSPTQQRLDATKKDLDYHKQKAKETEEALAKMVARRYSVPEDEIEQLVAISAKTADECKDILSRYAPGGNRMSLASNEVFGVELAGGEVDDFAQGDKKGELKYAIKSIKKKVAQVELRVSQLNSQVETEKESTSAVAVLKVGQLQEWVQIEGELTVSSSPRAVGKPTALQIAATRSELVVLSASGSLYSWAWNSDAPSVHPRAEELCPPAAEDPVVAVSCSDLRTSVLTQDGRVASWMDPMCKVPKMSKMDLRECTCTRLEHKATNFASFDAKVVQLAVSDYGTCAVTALGSAYWWGQRPWPMRVDRFKSVQESDTSVTPDQIYADYLETFSKKDRKKAQTKEELLQIATQSAELEACIEKEEAAGSKEAQTRVGLLRRLNRLAMDETVLETNGMQEGDIVVARPGGDWCLHPTGAACIAQVDGRSVLAKIEQPIYGIDPAPIEVSHNGRSIQCSPQHLTMLQLERRPKQAVLSCLDKERGIAVTCDISKSTAEPDSYDTVDVSKLAVKTTLHDELEAIVVEPIQIMEAARLREPIAKYAMAQARSSSAKAALESGDLEQGMCGYYQVGGAVEPSLSEYYSETLQGEYLVDEVVVDMWTTHVLVRKAGTLYRFVAQLEKGAWAIEPERCLDLSLSTPGQVLAANAPEFPVMHIDEGGFICSSRAAHLPATEFVSIGRHIQKLWGLDVVYGIFGFSDDRQSRRCNVLHDALADSSQSWSDLLEDESLTSQLPRLLLERDSFGATSFFSAMSRGNLPAANAIRLKAQMLSEAGNAGVADVLILPDIFGTPPLHALLGLAEGTARTKSAKREARKVHTQPCFEVSDGGSPEVNGLYHPVTHKTYRGPTLYRKVDADVYMFRWKRAQWVIGPGTDFSESRPRSVNWYTVASGSPPAELPVEGSWQLSGHGNGVGPAPRVFKRAGLLEMILQHDAIVTARSGTGETALETHIRSRARSPPRTKSDDIAKTLAANPAAVHGCFHDADGSPVPSVQLDDFVCRLVSCGSAVAAPLAQKVSEMAAEHGPAAREMGNRFMESCARIFVTLFSSDNVHSATAELRTVFTAIFKEAPQPAILALARQADAVLQLVRVGLPLPTLQQLTTYTSPPRPGTRSGGDMPEITGSSAAAAADDGAAAPTTAFSIRITARKSSRSESRRSSSSSNTAEARKLERVKIFHLCVVEVTALMGNIASSFPRALSRTYSTAHPWQSRTNETDMALLEAAKTLQPSWEYLFECADIMEGTLELKEQVALPSTAETGESTPFMDFSATACGHGTDPSVDKEHCSSLALIMDALVRFKLCLPDIDAIYTDVLVPTVSVFQLPAPENFRDLENAEKSEQLLKKIGIDVNDTDDERRAGRDDGHTRLLLEYPLLKALFRWRRTLAVLTTAPEVATRGGPDDDSFLNLFEPFDKKQKRLKDLMSERRRTIPEKTKALCIRVQRAPVEEAAEGQPAHPSPLAQELFDGLAQELKKGEKERKEGNTLQPLCRNLDKKNPWYRDAPGVGEGVVRMVLSDVANAILAGVGAAEGLMMPAPLVAQPEDGDLTWWEINPMARITPAPLEDAGEAEFLGKSIAELKQFLSSRKVPPSELEACVEKSDVSKHHELFY